MGNLLSGNMSETLKKNQELMQRTQMERQIQMQYQLQERQMAMLIARSRDTCLWFTAFYTTAATGILIGFKKTKKPFLLAPLVPLTFATLYYWDAAYGNKVHRIRMEAEHIMTHEGDSLKLPCGLPTLSSIDLGRLDVEDKK